VTKFYITILVSIVLKFLFFNFPFGIFNLFVQYQTGHFLLFLTCICFILFVGAVYFVFKRSKSKISILKIDILLLSFFVLGIICSVQLKVDFGQSKEVFLELIGLSIIFFIIRNSKSTIISLLFFAFIIAGFLQSTIGILQLTHFLSSNHSQFNVTGSFNNPGPFAGYLASILPFSVFLVWFSKPNIKYSSTRINYAVAPLHFFKKTIHSNKRVTLIVALLSTISIMFMIIVTESRAAWLAIIISMLYLVFQFYKPVLHKKKELWKTRIEKSNFKFKGFQLLFSILVIVIISLASVGLYRMKKDSADGRRLIWNVTSKMIQDKPLFGHGTNGFQANYMEYQANFFETNSNSNYASLADNNTYAFNEFLRISSEYGLVGLITVLVILYLLLFSKQKNNLTKNEILLLISAKAGLISILVFGLFSYPLEILPIKLNLVLFMAIITSFQEPIFTFQQNNFSFNNWGRRIVGVILVGLSILLLSNISDIHKAQRSWKLGYTTFKLDAYKHSLKYYEDALPILNSNGEFLIQYAKALSLSGEDKKAITQLEQAIKYLPNSIVYTTLGDSYKNLGEFDLAIESYLKAALMVPNRFYPKYLLAKLYVENGYIEEAIEIAKEILMKKVKIESMAIIEMKEEMKKIIEISKIEEKENNFKNIN